VRDLSLDAFRERVRELSASILSTRPTGVNLAHALARVTKAAERAESPADAVDAMRAEATLILEEDRAMCRRIGEAGVHVLQEGSRVLTHCNAGALGTAGIGTALAPLYVAAERGVNMSVLVTETRPLLQGSRLTAWELDRAGIPVKVITDSAAAARMKAGDVDLCLVGADRIVANGDVANKIGTYALAVLAKHHRIPFFVAAPMSTVDPSLETGEQIVVEQRDPSEIVGTLGGANIAADNPAFDVTPASLVSAIITDQGILSPPYAFTSFPEP
jgi:methylthioribose-1-phosphate isomerase